MKYKCEEYFIGSDDEGGGKVDIVAEDIKTGKNVFLELKGPTVKARSAWGQLYTYIKTYEHFTNKSVLGYIVGKGYPFGIYDDFFGLIGYVIENNKISFIP